MIQRRERLEVLVQMASTTLAQEMTLFTLSNRGFTLIELVMVILLLGVLGTVTVSMVGSYSDGERYEQTRQKMEVIRAAILGDDARDSQGNRIHFGYVGDWGSLPTALSNLTTAQVPAWSFDSTYGVGAGWRGPYVEVAITGTTPFTQDAWGRNFVWNTAVTPPTLTSYGSDGAAGGTLYGSDLVMTFPANLRTATVSGIVSDGDTRLSGKTVEIRYPVAGVLTAFTTVSAATGLISFANVPFGVRSMRVTTAPVLGPRNITVDKSPFELPNAVLNYFGSLQAVTVTAGSANTFGAGNRNVQVDLTSTYQSALQPDYMTVTWAVSGGGGGSNGYLTGIRLNGTTQAVPNLATGNRIDITAAMSVPANSTTNDFQLFFARDADGTNNINFNNADITVTFEWVGVTDTDAISFVP